MDIIAGSSLSVGMYISIVKFSLGAWGAQNSKGAQKSKNLQIHFLRFGPPEVIYVYLYICDL